MHQPARLLAAASLALLPLLPAHAEPMNLKLGLWEHTQATVLDGMSIPEAAMKNMPPEQRARMEAMLKQQQGRGPGAPMAVRSCLTRDKLNKPLVEPGGKDPARCTHTLLKSTATVQEFKFQCGKPEESTGTMRLETQSPEHYKGTLRMTSAHGNVTMQMEGRWISADCGSVKD